MVHVYSMKASQHCCEGRPYMIVVTFQVRIIVLLWVFADSWFGTLPLHIRKLHHMSVLSGKPEPKACVSQFGSWLEFRPLVLGARKLCSDDGGCRVVGGRLQRVFGTGNLLLGSIRKESAAKH